MIFHKDEIKLTVTIIIAFSAFSIFLTTILLRRRRKTPCYLHNTNSKPQTSFKLVLADNSYHAFKHLNPTEGKPTNLHPYEKEIKELVESSDFEEFSVVNGEVDLEMKESFVWVDKEEQLLELEVVLSKESVFAVDTEQHSLRSFLGFTALMQISTRNEDYLVDTIALHDVMGILRPVFANPKICKVFHGAHNDVIWLQRDFHIYVVNLYDTAKACEVLSKPQKSLAYLLETYCGVVTNKKLQLKDWRLRPLSEELIQYARADAHYLLYIAYCMANELKVLNTENAECLDDKFHFVHETRRRSNMICLQLYTKEIEASPGKSAVSSILSRHVNGQGGVSLSSRTMELVERLCMWRDLMARMHDESLRYVLSNQAIVALASKAPSTVAEIRDIISKVDVDSDILDVESILPSPSPVVCSHLEDICDLLAKKISSLDDVFRTIIQKHLGPNGSCPLSIFNYALLANSNLKISNGSSTKRKEVNAPKRFGRKASRQLFVQKFSCKSPVYHNCRIYASDGRMLCYCDRRKLEWYLRRDLAELVDNDPPAIMLRFEPKGRPEDEDNDFYIQSKKNMCVGCGEKNHYLRYRIIPSCYRVHFPEHLKSHRSHDIVLLCVDCHEIAHSAAEKYKRQISAEFEIPLFVRKVTDSRQTKNISGTSGTGEDVDDAGVCPSQLRTAAMALLRHGSNMPTKRREELTQTVMKFFGGRKISEEDLERALLVGMSPRERKRLEKKRGISIRHSSRSHLSNKGSDSNTDSLDASAHAETLGCDATGGSQMATEDENLYTEMELNPSDIHECSDSEVQDPATDDKSLKFNETTITKKENILDADEDLESRMLSDDTSHCESNETASSTYSQKLSLLGHGPHGKQVVDHLLEEYGEDGIGVFCQRWRQVFVESINPRYLPSGWDVMHRGRREFGEYSVYNPLKKVTSTATV